MNCSACKKIINSKEIMKCRLCIGKYHRECLNVDRKVFSSYTREYLLNWMCPACSNTTRRPRPNDSTPVRQSATLPQDSMDMSCDLSDASTSASPSTKESSSASLGTHNEVTMDKMSTLLDSKLSVSLSAFMDNFRRALRDDVKEMVRCELESVTKSIKDEFSATTDFICAEQTSLRSDIDKNIELIKRLETERTSLQTEIIKLNTRLAGVEKISRSCNIELQAVPEKRTENVLLLVKKLFDVIKVPIDDGQISSCRRVAKHNPESKRPRNIIVSFTTPRLRDLVLSASHRFNKSHSGRGLLSTDLDIQGETSRIFVSEHLSPEQKTLHAATRREAKEHNFKYVWIRYGQIYVRKDDSSGAILIKSLDSLKKLHQ